MAAEDYNNENRIAKLFAHFILCNSLRIFLKRLPVVSVTCRL